MSRDDPVLEFRDVAIAASPARPSLRHVSARFLPGALALIQLEPGNDQLPLADLAEGLRAPDEGRVLFQGEDWTKMTPERVLQWRGRIGRVFGSRGWISNLNVIENVTLSQRHHTRRADGEILSEAAALARGFGMEGLPKVRPALVPQHELRRAEWVRAFLGRPLMVFLECPMRDVQMEHLPRMISAVHEACARGTAVVWMTDNDRIARRAELSFAARYAMRGSTLVTMENG